jgi:hypothetical protein
MTTTPTRRLSAVQRARTNLDASSGGPTVPASHSCLPTRCGVGCSLGKPHHSCACQLQRQCCQSPHQCATCPRRCLHICQCHRRLPSHYCHHSVRRCARIHGSCRRRHRRHLRHHHLRVSCGDSLRQCPSWLRRSPTRGIRRRCRHDHHYRFCRHRRLHRRRRRRQAPSHTCLSDHAPRSRIHRCQRRLHREMSSGCPWRRGRRG